MCVCVCVCVDACARACVWMKNRYDFLCKLLAASYRNFFT